MQGAPFSKCLLKHLSGFKNIMTELPEYGFRVYNSLYTSKEEQHLK